MARKNRDDKPDVVVVTGASAGVGRAVVRELARRRKAHIALLARGIDGLEGARKEVEEAGGKALVIPTDVSDADAVEAAAERTERELGPIDIWINDAMTTVFAPFQEVTPEEFRRGTEVTYLGAVWGTRAALKRMVPRNHGTVVQVGSALAYRAIPLQSVYCGSKFAMRGFTDAVRTELKHQGSKVHITMVHLPGLNTPQFNWCLSRLPNQPQPVPPIFQPEVAARGIVWAAYHRRREVYVGGSTAVAVWGNKVAPSVGDAYLARTGYEGQQTDQPVAPNRPANLFEPVPGDHGAHGIFDQRSKKRSFELWASLNRRWLLGSVPVLAAAGVGVGLALAKRRA